MLENDGSSSVTRARTRDLTLRDCVAINIDDDLSMKIKNVFLIISIISGIIGITGGFGSDMIDGFAKAFAGVFFIMFYVFHVFMGPQMGLDATPKGKH